MCRWLLNSSFPLPLGFAWLRTLVRVPLPPPLARPIRRGADADFPPKFARGSVTHPLTLNLQSFHPEPLQTRVSTAVNPLLLLLGAIGIHASAKGLCYPSQRRLASLCGRSPSWAGKYLRELVALGYVRRLIPPRYRGPRAAWRLQVLWRQGNPIPENETSWETFPWCWSKKAPSDLET